jgi:hypothetical protein
MSTTASSSANDIVINNVTALPNADIRDGVRATALGKRYSIVFLPFSIS